MQVLARDFNEVVTLYRVGQYNYLNVGKNKFYLMQRFQAYINKHMFKKTQSLLTK